MKRSPRIPSTPSDASDSEFEIVDVKRDDTESDPSSSFEQKHFDFTFVDKSIEWARKTDVEVLSIQVQSSADSDAESVETAELVAVTQSVAQQLSQNTVHVQNPPQHVDRDTEPSHIHAATLEAVTVDTVVARKSQQQQPVAPHSQQDDFKTLWLNHQRRFLLASTTVLFGLVLAGIAAFFVLPRQNSAKAPPADPIVVPITPIPTTTQSNSINQVPKTDAIYQNKFSLDLEGLREKSTVHSLATPASTKNEISNAFLKSNSTRRTISPKKGKQCPASHHQINSTLPQLYDHAALQLSQKTAFTSDLSRSHAQKRCYCQRGADKGICPADSLISAASHKQMKASSLAVVNQCSSALQKVPRRLDPNNAVALCCEKSAFNASSKYCSASAELSRPTAFGTHVTLSNRKHQQRRVVSNQEMCRADSLISATRHKPKAKTTGSFKHPQCSTALQKFSSSLKSLSVPTWYSKAIAVANFSEHFSGICSALVHLSTPTRLGSRISNEKDAAPGSSQGNGQCRINSLLSDVSNKKYKSSQLITLPTCSNSLQLIQHGSKSLSVPLNKAKPFSNASGTLMKMMEYLSLPPSPDFSMPFNAFRCSSSSDGKECPVASEDSKRSGDCCSENLKPSSTHCPFSIEAALSMHGAAIRAVLSKVTPTATSSKIEGDKANTECAAPTNSISMLSSLADQAPLLLKEWASSTQAQISKSLNEISTTGASAVYEASSRMIDATWESFPDAWKICKVDQQQQPRSLHCTKAPIGLVGDGVCKPKSHAYTLGRKAAEIREWGRTALKETKSLIELNLPTLRAALEGTAARAKNANMCVNTASPEHLFRAKACKAKKDREWIGLKKVWTRSKKGLKIRGDLVRKGFKNVIEQFQAGWIEGRNHM
ncbi:hypothetical protein BJ741DRAFT_600357 [Chytriomyces cf. hyalinus JEL632]|nr:hypothetical protein BJ741DRAFT_600357 [Chytriomyces cf. hyalinus JEL632]